mgnify:CR=1 FL=1
MPKKKSYPKKPKKNPFKRKKKYNQMLSESTKNTEYGISKI